MADDLGDQAPDEGLALVLGPAQVLHFVAVPHHGNFHAILGANERNICNGA